MSAHTLTRFAKQHDATAGDPASLVVLAGFLVLFPGFFFYHSAVGIGYMPAVFGGFFSPMALAMLPALLFCYLYRLWRDPSFFSGTDLAVFGFLVYFFFVVAFNYATDTAYEPVYEHMVAILQWVSVYIIFRSAHFGSDIAKFAVLLGLAGMATIVFSMSSNGFFNLTDVVAVRDTATIVTYQGFARSYLMAQLVVVPHINSPLVRLLAHAVCLPVLFLNGARSELVGAVIAIALIEIVRAKRRLPLIGFIVAATYLLFGAHIKHLAAMYPNNRTLELLDLSNSSSWDSRSDMLHLAQRTIADNPLMGDYSSYFIIAGPGSYAHNIFSAWVDLGLPGFLYLVLLMLVPIVLLLRDLAREKDRALPGEYATALCLLVVTLFLVCTVKDFTYLALPAAFGAYARYRTATDSAKDAPDGRRRSEASQPSSRAAQGAPGGLALPDEASWMRIEKMN
ncbi:MAG TPA: hypothetical protein VIM12_20925 [Noviherbaspirillum sp.]|jgi:hypothetical protein|uniref:hypothetical protein n=1 Tax=Noviherbaspirillum sp. TaxID=1926288 RepID=UPI002F926EC2